MLPEPSDREARLGLALYAEALRVNSVPYAFLGFFKIINIVVPDGGASQEQWVNANVDAVSDKAALARVADLRAQGRNVGKYLYESGRCAIAHARTKKAVPRPCATTYEARGACAATSLAAESSVGPGCSGLFGDVTTLEYRSVECETLTLSSKALMITLMSRQEAA